MAQLEKQLVHHNRGSSNHLLDNGGNNTSGTSATSYYQGISADTDYHFNSRFSLGVGYRFYDFRFSFPGRPGQEAHWPYVRGSWEPVENLFLTGNVGIIISHTQGGGDQVNPGGIGQLEYRYRRGHLSVYGGQEPFLTSAFGSVGTIRQVNGSISLLLHATPDGKRGRFIFRTER